MTLSEFKAWFEGYTEGLDGAPTEKQFERIKAKVAEITGTPISYPVFVNRYRDAWPAYRDAIWQNPIVSYSAGSVGIGVGKATFGQFSVAGAAPESARFEAGPNQTVEWDSHAAMFAAGKADALAA